MDSAVFWRKARRAALLVVMAVVGLTFLYPLVYTLITSTKSNQEIFTNPFGMPQVWSLASYVKAWTDMNLQRYFLNSVVLTVGAMAFHLLFGTMAAYAIARFDQRLIKAVGGYLALGMMIPIQAILIPIVRMAVSWGASNQLWFLLCVYIAGGLPSTVFIVSAYLRTFPGELEEAAIVDGCGPWRFFWWILVPVSRPIIVTMGIISFISTWNELMVAMVLISDNNLKTLPLGLLNFTGAYSTDYAGLCAAVIITIIPTLVLYLAFQESVEKGLSEGAVKG